MEITFGANGLQAKMGDGEKELNLQTIRKLALGLACYVQEEYEEEKAPHIAIVYDSRNHGEEFAREIARILAFQGCEPWIYPKPEPVSALSFVVRQLHCTLGICMTANHKPAEYNGCRIYRADGSPIGQEEAQKINRCVHKAMSDRRNQAWEILAGDCPRLKTDFNSLRENGKICWIQESVLKAFLGTIVRQCACRELVNDLKVVYTPLHGAGLSCVVSLLRYIGIRNLKIVPEQAWPDGSFPTCPKPSPLETEALKPGLLWCQKQEADLLLATGPDGGSLCVAARRGDTYQALDANQTGVLLLDYLLHMKQQAGTLLEPPILIKPITSTEMAEKIIEHYGGEWINTLPNFHYIGEELGVLETEGDTKQFVFAFEENGGYLAGPYARDKDAIGACMLLCEMADALKTANKTLWDRLEELYEKYGYYEQRQQIYPVSLEEGENKMAQIREGLENNPEMKFKGSQVLWYRDYLEEEDGLPTADVLELWLENKERIVIRPSEEENHLIVFIEFVTGNCYTSTNEQAEGI